MMSDLGATLALGLFWSRRLSRRSGAIYPLLDRRRGQAPPCSAGERLGNDAAHIKSKDYDKVGKQEGEVALELTKEILKAVYQYDDLLGRLQALKKADEPAAA
jgi:hypothetical protein